jgi:dipeptide/tripeptide permease
MKAPPLDHCEDGNIPEFLVTDFVSILTFALCIPIFEFLIYPFLRNHIPRTTVRIGIGMFVILFGLLVMLVVDVSAHYVSHDGSICMFYTETDNVRVSSLFLVIVIVIMTVGELLAFLPMLEFICAQAPYSMRGLMIGIVFMVYGLAVGLVGVVLLLFSKGLEGRYKSDTTGTSSGPSCGTWYIGTVLVIGCVGTVLYIVAAKRYKKRQRGGQNDVNQQTVVETYHERFDIIARLAVGMLW